MNATRLNIHFRLDSVFEFTIHCYYIIALQTMLIFRSDKKRKTISSCQNQYFQSILLIYQLMAWKDAAKWTIPISWTLVWHMKILVEMSPFSQKIVNFERLWSLIYKHLLGGSRSIVNPTKASMQRHHSLPKCILINFPISHGFVNQIT